MTLQRSILAGVVFAGAVGAAYAGGRSPQEDNRTTAESRANSGAGTGAAGSPAWRETDIRAGQRGAAAGTGATAITAYPYSGYSGAAGTTPSPGSRGASRP